MNQGTHETPGTWKDITIEAWENIDCVLESNCKVRDSRTIPAHRAMRMIRDAILKRTEILFGDPLDVIVIEQQPLRRGGGKAGVGSARNKILEHVLSIVCDLYFRLKLGIEPPEIALQSAKYKLCVKTDPEQFFFSSQVKKRPKEGAAEKTTYAQRKKQAVQTTHQVLSLLNPECGQNREIITRFGLRKNKEDDRADSLLQGIYKLQESFPKPPPKRKIRKNGS